MKNILLIGVGGTGSTAVDIFFQKRNELGNQTGNNITALVFDTDAGDLKKITAAKTVVMADNASVGTICDRFGKEYLKEWFPSDDKAVRAQEMLRGASQWRKKSYLAFLNLMNKPLARQTFISALEEMSADPSASCEIYVIASIAGGTGSGSFIPIALYAKRYLRRTLGKDPIVNAMIALPDIYADSQTPENRIKVYSNAYAILRELNAINLVARNYNAGTSVHKKTPIRFRIGDPNEPSVGLLFDASDKQFWTPEAAPFSQVFLLDRIPGLNSVTAHNIVIANSLYTILCTDIGSAFDSEFSNHELLRSQSNGSNAIYAGISTSQIRFPKESVLDYLAHKKTLDSCNNEWLILHRAVESEIREREQQAKACKRRYVMKDDEYARIVLSELEKLEDGNNDEIISILERCVYRYNKEGKKITPDVATVYATKIDEYISKKITSIDDVTKKIDENTSDIAPQKGKGDKTAFTGAAAEIRGILLKYYQECIEDIKRMSGSTADAILSLDTKKAEFVSKDRSVLEALLKKDGKYIHPVAAVIQLCQLRKAISESKKQAAAEEWADLTKRSVKNIPSPLLQLSADDALGNGAKPVSKGKSAYLDIGEERFALVSTEDGEDEYLSKARTDMKADAEFLKNDALAILDKIYRGAQAQIRFRVYKALERDIDILIGKYRSFFNRFEKEKDELKELTKTAYLRDMGNVDSVINVYSSKEDKDAIYKIIVDEAGPITDEEIIGTDDIVGKGVYESVFNAAAAEYSKNNNWNEKDSSAYRSLFNDMIKAYRCSIEKNERFEEIASYSVIEAMIQSAGGDKKKQEETFKQSFSVAQELATPSLRIDAVEAENDLVRPSNIMVFMMSKSTGKYLKKHAEEFGLHLPADQTNENNVIRSCAEEFIRTYSGNNSARVSIVDSMPNQVLYCTGEIMDITPLRIAKFNELGENPVYFRNYSIAIKNFKKYGTDMWNPHLGNNLHKRGYLPYMNEEKENECDVKLIKAMLFGFQNGRLVYKDGMGEAYGRYYFECDGRKITDEEGRWINNKNVAQLIGWLRNEDELVEEWSALFDRDIAKQKNALPSLASENSNEIQALEASLTGSTFMQMLTEKLYLDPSERKTKAGKKVKLEKKPVIVERQGPTVLEFAYMIKTSEEAGHDCDDAERILHVVYDVFKDMCAYRTTPENTPECFIQVYKQQLGKVYETLATAKTVVAAGSECRAHFKQLLTWLYQTGVFNTISADTPMDDKGNVCIDTLYNIDDNELRRTFDFIKKGFKDVEDEETSPEADKNADIEE